MIQTRHRTFMEYIPFIPLYRFVRIVIKFGGPSGSGILHLAPWLLKLTLFEPFRWLEAIISTKRILQTPINHPPVFILGHYRSGTTLMQRIFTHDNRFGTMSIFQQIAPDLMLLWERPLTKVIQWVSDLFKAQNHFHRVPYDWSYPGEEDVGMMAMLSSYSPSWGFIFPKKFKEIYDPSLHSKSIQKQEGWKQDYLHLLKKITRKSNGKPLLLKSPPNTARVNELIELFPQARFIYISRNRRELFSSTSRLWDVVLRFHSIGSTRGINKDELVQHTMEMFRLKWNESKKHLRPEQFIEVEYESLLNQPMAVMQEIYTHFQFPDFTYCEKAMQDFIETQKSYKTLVHHFSVEEPQIVETQTTITESAL